MSHDRIKVLCRVRPAKSPPAFAWSDRRIHCLEGKERERNGYLFQKVVGPEQGNGRAYSEVRDAVEGVLEGVNATVMAYGHTSAGKTHTMLGTPEEPGIILRSVDTLIESLEGTDSTVTISYFEIYMERVYDLLSSDKRDLEVSGSAEDVVIPGLISHEVATLADGIGLISKGQDNRRKVRTNLNEHSSRSHTVFQIDVVKRSGARGVRGQLRLVDLAGSENSKLAGTSGDTQREGGNINRSLLALTNVIYSLASRSGHIPYRDAKLTRILQNSLGGNARTRIICCVSPSKTHVDETLQTLQFSDRARVVFNSVKVNEVDGSKTVPLDTVAELVSLYHNEILKASEREEQLVAGFKSTINDLYSHMVKEHEAEAYLWAEADYIGQKVSRQASAEAGVVLKEKEAEVKKQRERVERERARHVDEVRRVEAENRRLAGLVGVAEGKIEELCIVIQDLEEQARNQQNNSDDACLEPLVEANQRLAARVGALEGDVPAMLGAVSLDPEIEKLRGRLSGLKRMHQEMCSDMSNPAGGEQQAYPARKQCIKIFEDAVAGVLEGAGTGAAAGTRSASSSVKSVMRSASPLKSLMRSGSGAGMSTPRAGGKTTLATPKGKAKAGSSFRSGTPTPKTPSRKPLTTVNSTPPGSKGKSPLVKRPRKKLGITGVEKPLEFQYPF